MHHVLERDALAAQGLGPLRIVPDVARGQLALDLGQALALEVVVKGTP